MRKATTIKRGSCSRPARPRKALGACAQVSPSSTVSPKGKKGVWDLANKLVLHTRHLQRVIPQEFKDGMSVYDIATKHGCTILCVEIVLRRAMGALL